MSHHPRPSLHNLSSTSSAALQSRVAAKRAELESLKQLQDLSAQLAAQMAQLEAKLGTLRDGAESVAAVMENWKGVLGAIGMAGQGVREALEVREEGRSLPGTLVRIPVGDGAKGGGG